MTWGGLLRASSLGVAASLLFLVTVGAIAGAGADPFLVVFGLVFAFGAIWQARWRGGATFVAVVATLWLAMTIAFGGIKALGRPASWAEFVVVVASIVFPSLAVFAYRSGKRAGWDTRISTRPLTAAASVVAVALVVGLIATFTTSSATARPGDVRVVAKRFEFAPTQMTARAGRISVFVENGDPSHHDWTIEGVARVEVPSFHARRATFVVQPGSYEFVCTLHPEMKGTLKAT